jgi:hypothetical protein
MQTVENMDDSQQAARCEGASVKLSDKQSGFSTAPGSELREVNPMAHRNGVYGHGGSPRLWPYCRHQEHTH